MTARRNEKEKDAIDQLLDRIDFHGMSKDELTGQSEREKADVRHLRILEKNGTVRTR